MKALLTIAFVGLLSLTSFSQVELDEESPLLGTWQIASDYTQADTWPFGEPISSFTFKAAEERSSVIVGADLNGAPEYIQINMNDNGIMVLQVLEGSSHVEKVGSKFLISIKYDPASDALFVTTQLNLEVGEQASPKDQAKKMIFTRK